MGSWIGTLGLAAGAFCQTYPFYTVVDLGPNTIATAINDSGQVTGFSSATNQGFIYSNGVMVALPSFPGTTSVQSVALGINKSGAVTGDVQSPCCDDIGLETRAFLYREGVMTDLGTLGGMFTIGNGINDTAQITGYSFLSASSSALFHAFLYSNGTMTDLGAQGDIGSVGTAINNSGQITGFNRYSSGDHGFLYSGGVMSDINLPSPGVTSEGLAINAIGQVAGYFFDGRSHAFLYSHDTMYDLGTLAGYTGYKQSFAEGINDIGQVVGVSYENTSTAGRAFVYSDGVMTDLNALIDPTLGITLGEAKAINNQGQIVAQARQFDGPFTPYYHAYLLTPVTHDR
jgi:probable HAF family extracellular repeat protein